MVARGILHNPAMFAGYDSTPVQCVKDWVGISCTANHSPYRDIIISAIADHVSVSLSMFVIVYFVNTALPLQLLITCMANNDLPTAVLT